MVLKVATGVTGSGLSFTAAEGCICDVVNVAAAEDGKLADLSLAAERAAVKLNAAADVEVVPVPDDVLPNSDLSPEPDPKFSLNVGVTPDEGLGKAVLVAVGKEKTDEVAGDAENPETAPAEKLGKPFPLVPARSASPGARYGCGEMGGEMSSYVVSLPAMLLGSSVCFLGREAAATAEGTGEKLVVTDGLMATKPGLEAGVSPNLKAEAIETTPVGLTKLKDVEVEPPKEVIAPGAPKENTGGVAKGAELAGALLVINFILNSD